MFTSLLTRKVADKFKTDARNEKCSNITYYRNA